MGSRMMPMECAHGWTVDWGDFGPCQDCDEHDGERCPNYTPCPQCEAERHPSGLSGDLIERLRRDGWELVRTSSSEEGEG